MELIKQFQGFVGSIGFGFFFYMSFHFVYRLTNDKTIFIKGLIYLFCFLFVTYLYYLFLSNYVYGILNIFYPLSIIVGVLFYHFFFFQTFNNYYLYSVEKYKRLIKLKKKKLFDIIIYRKKRDRNGKIGKNKKSIN